MSDCDLDNNPEHLRIVVRRYQILVVCILGLFVFPIIIPNVWSFAQQLEMNYHLLERNAKSLEQITNKIAHLDELIAKTNKDIDKQIQETE